MSSKFLDKTGLDTLWAKIKSMFQTLGNLVTAWGSTPSDTKYPSEKLVKNSLDGKVSVSDVKNASWGVNILRQSFQAKNGTTVDNTNKTITATYDTSKSTDIYCYATTSVPIVLGETYTISFDVIESNLTEGQYWEWGFFGQGHAVFRITGTGHYSKTLVSDINRSVGYSALIDDSGKSLSNGSYIVMKNIKYEIGPFETKYSDLDSLLVTGYNALSTTLGPMIRALGSWSNPAEGEFIPAASGSSQGRYTLRKIFDFFKSLMVSDSGVNISGNAGTATTATTAAGYTSGGAIDTALQGKVDKVSGKGLSTNDFTTDEKDKLAGIASGAEVNVQSDWNQTDSTADDYIKNKPQNLVQDASYVHTDNNYTTEDKGKVASAVQPGDLGSAAYKDVPATGDASTTQVVMGSDSRLSDARPASDVSAWAKADTKPTYTASDVGAAPSSHQHSTSDITSGTLPVGRGGTGKASVTAGNYLVGNGTSALAEKTPTAAANDMLSALPDDWTATPTDGVKLIRRDTGGGASFGQVTFLTVWNYIKTKIYNGSLGSENRPVYWTGSNLALSKPSPNANLMGSVGKTTAANARADTAALVNTTINCNNGSYYYLNAMKFIENVPYTFLIPSVNANKSGLVTSTKLKVYQIGASNFDLGTDATLYLDKAGGSSTLHEIVFAYRVDTTLYIFHQY